MAFGTTRTSSDLLARYKQLLKTNGDSYGFSLVRDTQQAAEGHLALLFAIGRAYQHHIPVPKDMLESSLYYLDDEDEEYIEVCKEMMKNAGDADV